MNSTRRSRLVRSLALLALACLLTGCSSGGGGPDACGQGAVVETCLCGGQEVSSGYCCSGVPSATACPVICGQGAVVETCLCGGQEVSSGYCCYGVPSATECMSGALIADHTSVAAFDSIPQADITQAASTFRIWYGHTSHGSQIVTGLSMLATELGAPYLVNQGAGTLTLSEESGDLGHLGDLTWEATTRAYLAVHAAEVNMVIWSWCGGVSDNTEDGIQIYLDALAQLELDFPAITFVYMTGHTDAYAVDNLRARNAQIRAWCAANGKVLFDFEDIESWDPDGTYYADTGDDCAWCTTWCASHTCPSCGDCAHSHCFNCYQKGKAFWWLLARLGGWAG